jgi:hypothetical protein
MFRFVRWGGPRFWLWFAPLLAWLLFAFWYTNTAGPLSKAEINTYTELMQRSGAESARIESLRRFMEEDDGGQFLMVNLLHGSANPDADAQMARYMAHMLPEMLRRASHPMLAGDVVFQAMDLLGIDGAEEWSAVGVVRYRSRRDLVDIALDPRFGGEHEFKIAALKKTIAVPVRPTLHLSDARLLLLLVLLSVVGIAHAVWRR